MDEFRSSWTMRLFITYDGWMDDRRMDDRWMDDRQRAAVVTGGGGAINLLHDVFDFVLFAVQDDASGVPELQVLKDKREHRLVRRWKTSAHTHFLKTGFCPEEH